MLTDRKLPEGPERIFRLAEPVLTAAFGPGKYRLGGGTALAAVWRHRHSTDIDLFMEHTDYRAGIDSDAREQRLRDELFEALQQLRPEKISVERGFAKVVCRDGEFGLYTPPVPLRASAEATDKVAGTRVEIERPAIILARKIHGRMLSNGVFTLRDLYDTAAASVLAPEDLEIVLDSVLESDKSALRDELRSLPSDWAQNPRKSGRALIRAERPAGLAKDPSACLRIVQQLLADDWSGADALRKASLRGATP